MGRVLFFSGAGLSADSGLGVFRGSGGLWEKYDINKVANFVTWGANYDLVHEFFNLRRLEYTKAQPNDMHIAIADLQKKYGNDNVYVITQNIDNLLENAGCTKVRHVHGRINYIHCIQCGTDVYIEGEFKGGKCEKCGGTLFKPSVVFFGEPAPEYLPMYETLFSLTSSDLVAVIGTKGSVVPIDVHIGSKKDGVPAKRLLCNLAVSDYIDDKNYDYVFYKRAKDAASEVKEIAEKILAG